MNYNIYLDFLAKRFQTAITNVSSSRYLPTEDFGWTNHRYQSDTFRLAHIERYSDDKIEVLHVTTFPHRWSPEPIFGFDVICTDNKILGAYMDFSPVIKTYDFATDVEFKDLKPVPEWATVFSKDFLTLKPRDDDEFVRFSAWALDKYVWYLHILSQKFMTEWEDEYRVIEMQNRYCEVQASNPRTYNVLKHKIGEQRAKHFMQDILFPKII